MTSPTQEKAESIENEMRELTISHVIIDMETHGPNKGEHRRHVRIYYTDGSSTLLTGQFWIKHHGPPGV